MNWNVFNLFKPKPEIEPEITYCWLGCQTESQNWTKTVLKYSFFTLVATWRNFMAQFRKKPVVIEAVQFDEQWAWDFLLAGRDLPDGVKFSGASYHAGNHKMYTFRAYVPTLEGEMQVNFGDWIIRGVKGEYYPCKPDIFEATYETC